MFGYVKVFAPELKVSQHEYYKAVYCGLCKTLGRRYGFLARLTLNYDFAFMAIVYKDILSEMDKVKKCRCIVHPIKKKSCACESLALDFSAACAMIMLYYKILDNIHDSSFIKSLMWRIVLPFFKGSYKKAVNGYDNLEKIIKTQMQRQFEIEKRENVFLDEAADPSACMLSEVCALMTSDAEKRVALSRFGYLLGRWVYLIDALDDIEKDKKQNSFNVFLNFENPQKAALESLNSTAAELQNAFESVGFGAFSPIIENVVYLGLKDTLNRILKKEVEINE